MIEWERRNSFAAHVVVNCTPVGMEPNSDEMVITESAIGNFEVVADLVMKPPKSLLIQRAENAGKKVVAGTEFMLQQFLFQFKLYTGQDPLEDVAREALAQLQKKLTCRTSS